MRPGRCSVDLRNLSCHSCFFVFDRVRRDVRHRSAKPSAAAFIGAVGETRAFFTGRDAAIEGNALGNLGRGGGPLVLVRGGLKRRLRALGVDHGRRASLGDPRDGGTGSGGGGAVGQSSSDERDAEDGLNWEGWRKCRIVAGAGTNEDVPA